MTDSLAPTRAADVRSSRRRGRASGVVTPYDFRRPVNLSRDTTRLLQITFEAYARQASTVLTTALRSVCTVDLVSVEQVSYSEYVDSLGQATYMAILSMEPLKTPAVLEMPLAVTMTCIDNLLGGPGTGPYPERGLTDLETAVVGPLYERLVAEFRTAFASLVDVEPTIAAVEYSPQLAQVAPASDVMVVSRFSLRMGEAEHPMSVCVSLPNLMPHLLAAGSADGLSESERRARAIASQHVTTALQNVPVDVAVRYRVTQASPLELAGLTVGDIVRLQHPAQAPLDVTAADVVFAHATAGHHGRHQAALVVASANQETA